MLFRQPEKFASRAGVSDLWAASFLVPDTRSDDGLLDLCTWLVSQGRTNYDAVLADPDRLSDVDDLSERLELAEEWS